MRYTQIIPTIMPPQSNESVIVGVAAGFLHCAYFFGMFYLFPRVPLWVMLILGFIYSVSILEHQRHFSQLHSQFIFPIAAAQSPVQHPGIDHGRI
jgi:hypothetical protein